ncbi:hypothetical protein ACQP1G_24040 [Nocardia sp. CA-107356]|uniref:hypothetical protein n=1 Tax=Nocardia sp. CA-107356 TaxID=3239972 RepID=UPI003D8A5413
MRQHIQQMPAPVVADALGYHYVTRRRGGSDLESLRHRTPIPVTQRLDPLANSTVE